MCFHPLGLSAVATDLLFELGDGFEVLKDVRSFTAVNPVPEVAVDTFRQPWQTQSNGT